MKRFIAVVFIFALLAFCSQVTAGQLNKSPEWRSFYWMHSEPVIVALTIQDPTKNSKGMYSRPNMAEVMRRLQLNGMDRIAADEFLFNALNEHYECPYLEYGHDIEEIFPADIEILLTREFIPEQFPYSSHVVVMLEASGLKHNEGQSLFYSSVDEHLDCLLEP